PRVEEPWRVVQELHPERPGAPASRRRASGTRPAGWRPDRVERCPPVAAMAPSSLPRDRLLLAGVVQRHSLLSASRGSTRAARRAGPQAAAIPAPMKSMTTMAIA